MSKRSSSHPYLTALISDQGYVVVGHVAPLDYIAVGVKAKRVLATLVHGQGESFDELVDRIDTAVGCAVRSGVAVNEVETAELVVSGQGLRWRRKD